MQSRGGTPTDGRVGLRPWMDAAYQNLTSVACPPVPTGRWSDIIRERSTYKLRFMPNLMIHVIAKISTVSGKRDAFLTEFHQLIPQVLAEAGCVQYTPTIDAKTDIDAQRTAGENAVVIVEQWESLQALQDHLAAEHMAAYRERVKDLVESVELEVFETAANPAD